MTVLIIEDEARIARRIERMARGFYGPHVFIAVQESLQGGLDHIKNHNIDVLLLDLNLNGENGFDILEAVVAGSFHTIIVSAYTEKAITAFAYGVLDFVPKPFDEARLIQALRRAAVPESRSENTMKFLAVKRSGNIYMIGISELLYIKGAGIYTELHLKNGRRELHDKSLEMLEQLLPPNFERIHKSYIVPLELAEQLIVKPGGKYQLLLENGDLLPVGRSRYKSLKDRLL